jgi:NDP-sugar pyrophosphorylase family protein
MFLLLPSMKAIVLAAGYGTRLSPLSNYLPKPLIPILGKPLLGHILHKLNRSGITDIGVNLHHHADLVRQFIAAQDPGLRISLSYEPEILGVAGGIGAFREFLKDEPFFMLHNGDVLSTIPVDRLAVRYQEKRPLMAMVLHNHPAYNNVSVAPDGTICDLRDTLRPAHVARKLAYTGIAFMDATVLDFIPAQGPADLIPVCLDIIREGKHRIEALIVDGCAWRDVGTVQSYFEVHRELLSGRTELLPDMAVPADGRFLAEDVTCEEGSQLRGFVSVGRRCVLKKNSIIENAILWDDVTIEEGVHIRDAIVGRKFIVHAG